MPFKPTPEDTKNREEIKRLRFTNELWDKYCPRWDFYLSAYEGGEEFANGSNLFRHSRENEEDYKDRVKRIHNINYCEQLVDFFTNFIFSEPIDRSGGSNDKLFRQFMKDVNMRGDDIDTFMRGVSESVQVFGMSYILVDAPQIPDGEVLTKYDEERRGIRPYWVFIRPQEILDWVVDKFGNLIYAKRVEVITELGASRKVLERYTEFFTDRIEVSTIDITSLQRPIYIGKEVLENALGTIPLIVVRHKRSRADPFIGTSFLRDLAYNNREVMNLTSLLQEFLYRQAFNILAREVDTVIPTAEQSDGNIGTSNVMDVPKGAQMPEYISPPADPAKFIQDERSKIKAEMFVRAAQDTMTELFNGEKASGFSQAQSFSKTVPFIASRAEVLERCEVALMDLTMKRFGKSWDGKIKYKDRYEITNLNDALMQLQTIVRDFQLPSETFAKEQLKRIVREYDGKLPIDTLRKIESDIDKMDFSDWMGVQKQALVGRGVSPAEQQQPKDTGTMAEVSAEAKVDRVAATKKLRKSNQD